MPEVERSGRAFSVKRDIVARSGHADNLFRHRGPELMKACKALTVLALRRTEGQKPHVVPT